MKRNVWILAGIVMGGIVFGIGSCSKSGNSSTGPVTGGAKDTVLVNIGVNVIIPAYQQLSTTTASLDVAAGAFVAAPGAGTLGALRTAYKDSYKAWAGCSEFEFGPASDKFLTTHFINSFPADTATIVGNINGGVCVMDGLGNYAAQGFPALDYLLYAYSDDAVLARFTTDGHASGAKQYLTVLTAALKAKSSAVANAWSASAGNYAATFSAATGVDAGSGLSLLANAFVQDFDVNLQNYKIGIPIGIYGPSTLPKSPKKVEGYYSGLSITLLIAQMQAYQRIYAGGGGGLDDKVAASKVMKDGITLDAAIANQIATVLAKMQALPETLSSDIENGSPAVQAAYTEVRKLTVLLKVDMSSALGIKISFQDDDGD